MAPRGTQDQTILHYDGIAVRESFELSEIHSQEVGSVASLPLPGASLSILEGRVGYNPLAHSGSVPVT